MYNITYMKHVNLLWLCARRAWEQEGESESERERNRERVCVREREHEREQAYTMAVDIMSSMYIYIYRLLAPCMVEAASETHLPHVSP